MSIVGVIADTHIPFCHSRYLDFICKTFDRHGVTEVVHIGDVLDWYAISDYISDPSVDSGGRELQKAKAQLKKWYEIFPKVKVCIGNHDVRLAKRLQKAGLPGELVKSFNDILDINWDWADHHVIDGVRYIHGTGSSGATGVILRAIRTRQSTVMGHLHCHAGVMYHNGGKDEIFAMNVGCGVDEKSYAMAYAKDHTNRYTLGCGIVYHGGYAVYEPLKRKGKYAV